MHSRDCAVWEYTTNQLAKPPTVLSQRALELSILNAIDWCMYTADCRCLVTDWWAWLKLRSLRPVNKNILHGHQKSRLTDITFTTIVRLPLCNHTRHTYLALCHFAHTLHTNTILMTIFQVNLGKLAAPLFSIFSHSYPKCLRTFLFEVCKWSCQQGTSGCTPPCYINCHTKWFWSSSCYKLDALHVAQRTAWKQWLIFERTSSKDCISHVAGSGYHGHPPIASYNIKIDRKQAKDAMPL